MRRREFITLLGGVAAAWPLAARAQQPAGRVYLAFASREQQIHLSKAFEEGPADNAVHLAHTPSFDALWQGSPHALLRTSGRDVGLPDGQMGNSEVGHLNIGAGRIVMQDLPRIDDAVVEDSMGTLQALTRLIEALKKSGGACHLMGLVSPGGVHSHQNHAVALAKVLTGAGIATRFHVLIQSSR